jgi:hypothetical protein
MTYARYGGIELSRPRTTLMAGRRKATHSWCAGYMADILAGSREAGLEVR